MAHNTVHLFIQRLKTVLRERDKKDMAMLESLRGIRFAYQGLLDYDSGLTDEKVQEAIMQALFKNPNILKLDLTGELTRLSNEITIDGVALAGSPLLPEDRMILTEVVHQCDLAINTLIRSIN
jgi:hypothetical protein